MNVIPLLLVAGFLLAGVLSCSTSIAFGVSLLFYLKMAAWGAAFLLGTALGKRPAGREIFPNLFVVSGLALCAMGYAFLTVSNKEFGSLASTFYQSDVFAGYLLLLIPIASSLAAFSRDRSRGVMYASSSLLFVLSLFLTDSRGAILTLVPVSLFWGMVIYIKKPKILKFVSAVFLLGLFLVAFIALNSKNEGVRHTFLTKARSSASWFAASRARLSFWEGGMKLFARHPWFGGGLDTFGRLFPMVQKNFFWYSKYPHNFYIQTLADGGLFMLLAVLALMALPLISGFRALRQEGEAFPLALGFLGAFLAGMFHLFLDVDSNFLMWSVPFWAIGGFMVSLDHRGTLAEPAKFFFKLAVSGLFLIFFGVQGAAVTASALDAKAQSLAAGGKLSEAVEREAAAIRLSPWDSNLFEHRARQEFSLCAAGEKQKCVNGRRDLEQALDMDPIRPLYLGELAEVLTSSADENKQAQALLERAIALDPVNYPVHYVELAELKAAQGDAAGAEKVYEEILKKFPPGGIARLPVFRRARYEAAVAVAQVELAKIKLKTGQKK